MKYYILNKLNEYLKNFNSIHRIKRVNNTTILIEFNKENILYFDMSKGNSMIYKRDSTFINQKDFYAPFDILLQKRFNNSKINKVYLKNNDKILNIEVQNKSSYKQQTTILQLEFTGRNTNAIILDKNNIILEALRHIDEWTSTRVVKVGIKLEQLKIPNFKYKEKEIEDIELFLLNIYKQKEHQLLENIKKQKIFSVKKQIIKITKLLNNLEDISSLKNKEKELNKKALDIVSNLYKFNGYEKDIKLQQSNNMFRDSKKTKSKIKNQHIEQVNLSDKLDFYNRLLKIIQSSQTIDEIEFYFPRKNKKQTITKKANPYQSFFIDGYKIMLGRDERENIFLLQNSHASDFWFHLQNQKSSHIIIPNKKKMLPHHIIEEAGKICAKFSTNNKGVFKVDYTQRRNVKIQSGANVLYNPYNTIIVKI